MIALGIAQQPPLAQAERLNGMGYHQAAVMMTRFAVEERLRRLCAGYEVSQCGTSGELVKRLYKAGRLGALEQRELRFILARCNRAVHHAQIDADSARRVLHAAQHWFSVHPEPQRRRLILPDFLPASPR